MTRPRTRAEQLEDQAIRVTTVVTWTVLITVTVILLVKVPLGGFRLLVFLFTEGVLIWACFVVGLIVALPWWLRAEREDRR